MAHYAAYVCFQMPNGSLYRYRGIHTGSSPPEAIKAAISELPQNVQQSTLIDRSATQLKYYKPSYNFYRETKL